MNASFGALEIGKILNKNMLASRKYKIFIQQINAIKNKLMN